MVQIVNMRPDLGIFLEEEPAGLKNQRHIIHRYWFMKSFGA